MSDARVFWPFHCARFTPESVAEILAGKNVLQEPILTQGYNVLPAPALEWLSARLNEICGSYEFAAQTKDKSDAQAAEVLAAIEALGRFFDRRRKACHPEGAGAPRAEIIDSEDRLRETFDGFVEAMRQHDFQLDMDAALLMPPFVDSWRSFAGYLDEVFVQAMSMGRNSVGISNDGPRAKFLSAVVPLITGEAPTVIAAGKHIRDLANGIRREYRARKHPTGTN